MAKRYIPYERLQDLASSLSPSGHYKPSGTMGVHHCTIAPNPDGSLTVTGSNKGRVTLREGDTLGYNCGDVWCLRKPTDALAIFRQRDKIKAEYGALPTSFAKSFWSREREGCGAGARTEEYRFFAIFPDGSERELSAHGEQPEVDRYEWVTTKVYNERWEVPSGAVAVLETYYLCDPTRKSYGYTKLWLGSARRNVLNAWAQMRLGQ